MAVQSAQSTTSTVSQTIQKYYDKLFLKIAESKLVHKQLGQHSTKIGQGEGGYGAGLIQWTKWANLPLVTAGQGEGVPTTAQSMTATVVTATPAQYDAAVSISDILAYTSFGDVMKAAISRLAYNAGLSIDTIVRNVVSAAGNQAINGSAVAYWSAVPADANLLITEVRKAVRALEAANAFRQDDGSYAAVIHPYVAYDLKLKSLLRSLAAMLIKKFREFGGTLYETIPSQARVKRLWACVETMGGMTKKLVNDIVRTIWRHIELDRNVLVVLC